MIRLREKDVLFCMVNVVGFFGACAWFLADYMMVIGMAELENIQGFTTTTMAALLVRVFAQTFILLLLWVVIMVDIWWIYRFIMEYYREYRRENL